MECPATRLRIWSDIPFWYFYLSIVRVCSAFINSKTICALCVASQFNHRRHWFEPVGWMFMSAQFVLALSKERDMLLAKLEHDLL